MDGGVKEPAGANCEVNAKPVGAGSPAIGGTFNIPFAERPLSLASQLPQVLWCVSGSEGGCTGRSKTGGVLGAAAGEVT